MGNEQTTAPAVAQPEVERVAPGPADAPALVLAAPSAPARVLALQRAAGNRAVGRMLALRAPRRTLARVLLEGLPEADRLRVKVSTVNPAAIAMSTILTPPNQTAAKAGGAKVSHLPPANTSYDPAIPAALQPALGAVAGWMGGTNYLPLDTTISIELDLTPYGGAKGVYRFTRVTSAGKEQVLVDQIGAPATAPAAAVMKSAKFDTHTMSISGTPPSGFEGMVRQVVELIPDHLLKTIAGLKFEHGGAAPATSKEAGHYSQADHKVTIYDSGTTVGATRYGDPGAASYSNPYFVLAHEIAHALDYAPVKRAVAAETLATQALNAWLKKNGTLKDDGTYSFPAHLQKDFDKLEKAAKDAAAAAEKSHGLSGADSKGEDDAKWTNAFTTAVGKNAEEITAYPHTRAADHAERLENFAELYAVFLLAPNTLKSLRPAIHSFMADLHADKIDLTTGKKKP